MSWRWCVFKSNVRRRSRNTKSLSSVQPLGIWVQVPFPSTKGQWQGVPVSRNVSLLQRRPSFFFSLPHSNLRGKSFQSPTREDWKSGYKKVRKFRLRITYLLDLSEGPLWDPEGDEDLDIRARMVLLNRRQRYVWPLRVIRGYRGVGRGGRSTNCLWVYYGVTLTCLCLWNGVVRKRTGRTTLFRFDHKKGGRLVTV